MALASLCLEVIASPEVEWPAVQDGQFIWTSHGHYPSLHIIRRHKNVHLSKRPFCIPIDSFRISFGFSDGVFVGSPLVIYLPVLWALPETLREQLNDTLVAEIMEKLAGRPRLNNLMFDHVSGLLVLVMALLNIRYRPITYARRCVTCSEASQQNGSISMPR